MAQSTYGPCPRERLDYAVLHVGKKVQFPTCGFSPEWSAKHPPDPYSLVLDTPHEHHEDPPSTDVTELQQQLESAKAANAALEHSTRMEQMRRELEGLRAWNAELETNFAPPQLHEGEKRSCLQPEWTCSWLIWITAAPMKVMVAENNHCNWTIMTIMAVSQGRPHYVSVRQQTTLGASKWPEKQEIERKREGTGRDGKEKESKARMGNGKVERRGKVGEKKAA